MCIVRTVTAVAAAASVVAIAVVPAAASVIAVAVVVAVAAAVIAVVVTAEAVADAVVAVIDPAALGSAHSFDCPRGSHVAEKFWRSLSSQPTHFSPPKA